MSGDRAGVVVPILVAVGIVATLTALLYLVAAAQAVQPEGLLRAFALLGASACVLLGGFAAWYLGRPDAGAQVVPAGTQSANHELTELRARLGGALEREREFSGHIAHELRTPLTVLRTGLDLMLRKQPPSSVVHGSIVELLDTVDEMSRMIDNLMLLARIEGNAEPPVMQPVAVRPLVETVWHRLEARATARGLRFENRIDQTHRFEADRGKLQLVLQNLLSNAVSYTDPQGEIVVDSGDGVLLSVWDSGPQLPADQLGRVFDRMWRADLARTDASTHAGLGLSLAQGLCRHMGITLAVENVEAGGLRFVLRAGVRRAS